MIRPSRNEPSILGTFLSLARNLHRSARRNSSGLGWSVEAIFLLLLASTALVRAGSIFDDDFVAPKSVEPSRPSAPDVTSPSTTVPADPRVQAPAVSVESHGKVSAESSTSPSAGSDLPILPHKPLPAPDALTVSRHNLKVAFAASLKDRSVPARKAFAQTLLDESARSEYSTPDQYAILCGAIVAAQEGRNARICFQAADNLSEVFAVDDVKLKIECVSSITLRCSNASDTAENASAVLKLVDLVVANEGFAEASRLLALVRPLAGDNSELRASVLQRSRWIESTRTASEQLQSSRGKLKSDPADPPSNLAIGRYYCFRLGRWEKGLTFLSKGSDQALRAIAQLELQVPADAAAALDLGSRWWDRAEVKNTPPPEAQAIKVHAASWYRAGEAAATGLASKAVQARLKEAGLLRPGDQTAIATADLRGSHRINLLKLIDLDQGADGHWTRVDKGVLQGDSGRVSLGYPPPDEYDLHLHFHRVSGNGELLNVVLVHGQRHFRFVGGAADNSICGFDMVRGQDVLHDNPTVVKMDAVFKDNHPCDLVISVRNDSFWATMDGALLTKYTTDYSDIGPTGYHDFKQPMLGLVAGNVVQFDMVEVKEISGSGTFSRTKE